MNVGGNYLKNANLPNPDDDCNRTHVCRLGKGIYEELYALKKTQLIVPYWTSYKN